MNLSLAARGAARGIIDQLDARGELYLGDVGLTALAIVLGRPWEECAPAVRELIEAQWFVFDAARGVIIDRRCVDLGAGGGL